MVHFLCLFAALSIDAFLANLSYGASGIKVSMRVNIIIATICSTFLLISLFAGQILIPFLGKEIISKISCIIFILLGIWKLRVSIYHHWKKKMMDKKQVEFHYHNIKLIISMMQDYSLADQDKSKDISIAESLFLGTALSIDSLIAGIAFAIVPLNPMILFFLCMLLNLIILESGYRLGKRICKKVHIDLSWVTSVLFFLLAFLRR